MKFVIHGSHIFTPFLKRDSDGKTLIHWDSIDRVEVTESELKALMTDLPLVVTNDYENNRVNFYGKPLCIQVNNGPGYSHGFDFVKPV